jgi:type II secretory pathway component PulF
MALRSASTSIDYVFVLAAFGWLGLGIALSLLAPRFDQLYVSIYRDWETSTSSYARAFDLPSYFWIAISLAPALLTIALGRTLRTKNARVAKACTFLTLTIALIMAFDWLLGFLFCHQWGCTQPFQQW